MWNFGQCVNQSSSHGGWHTGMAGALLAALTVGSSVFGAVGQAHAESTVAPCSDSIVSPQRTTVPADLDSFRVRTFGFYEGSVTSPIQVQRLHEGDTREDVASTVTESDGGYLVTLEVPLVEGERYVVSHPDCLNPGAPLETIYEVGASLGVPGEVPAPTIRFVEELNDYSTRHYLEITVDTEGLDAWHELMEFSIAVDGESNRSTRQDLSARASTEILVDCGEGYGLAEGTHDFNALLQSYGGTLSKAGEILSFEIDCENAEQDDRRGSALPGTPDGGTGTSTPPSDSSAGCSAMPMAGSGSGLGALALFALGLMRRRRR